MNEISFLYVEEAFNDIKPGYNGSDFSIKEDKEKAKKFFANGIMHINFNKKWLLYIKKKYLNSII